MGENNFAWIGPNEAQLFIIEFANESLREAENLEEGTGENLCFAELQRCFLPCDSNELRVTLSQRPCKVKQAYMPLTIEEKIATLIAKEVEFLQTSEQMRRML